MDTWDTNFDEVKNLMIHTFPAGIVVIFNRNFGMATVAKDGKPINRFDASEMLINEWYNFLINTLEQAKSCSESVP